MIPGQLVPAFTQLGETNVDLLMENIEGELHIGSIGGLACYGTDPNGGDAPKVVVKINLDGGDAVMGTMPLAQFHWVGQLWHSLHLSDKENEGPV